MKKKLLPVLTVFCLVILVLAAGVITFLIKKYTPSGEMMDGESYFQIQKNDEAALIVNRTVEEEKVKIIDGRYYVEDTVVGKYINGRFYWDANQKIMLYTLPLEEFQIAPETQQFQTSQGMESVDYIILKQDGDSYYLDLEFVKAYTDMECAVYENPARVVIRTNWDAAQMVTASADCKKIVLYPCNGQEPSLDRHRFDYEFNSLKEMGLSEDAIELKYDVDLNNDEKQYSRLIQDILRAVF